MRSRSICRRTTAVQFPSIVSVTALIPSVYEHIVLLMKQFGIEVLDTKFNYSVKYQG